MRWRGGGSLHCRRPPGPTSSLSFPLQLGHMQLHLGLPPPAHPPQLLKPCVLRHNLPILSLASPTFTMTASLFLFLICCWLKDLSSALLPRAEPDKSRHTWGRSGPTQVAARQLIITLLFVYHSFVCLLILFLFITHLFVYYALVCSNQSSTKILAA